MYILLTVICSFLGQYFLTCLPIHRSFCQQCYIVGKCLNDENIWKKDNIKIEIIETFKEVKFKEKLFYDIVFIICLEFLWGSLRHLYSDNPHCKWSQKNKDD